MDRKLQAALTQKKERKVQKIERAKREIKGSVGEDEPKEYNNSTTKRDQTAKGIRDLPLLPTPPRHPSFCGRAVHRAHLRDV